MFADTTAFSGFAVDDLEKAREFYGGTLGLRTSVQHDIMTLHLAGDRDTIVYPKPGHHPADYTILNFQVDDIDYAVGQLAERGVRVRALRGARPGREGHQPRRGPVHRLVQGPGRQHPGGPAGKVAGLCGTRRPGRPARAGPGARGHCPVSGGRAQAGIMTGDE